MIQNPMGNKTLEAPKILSVAMSSPVNEPCEEARAIIMNPTQITTVTSAKNRPRILGDELKAADARAKKLLNRFIPTDYPDLRTVFCGGLFLLELCR